MIFLRSGSIVFLVILSMALAKLYTASDALLNLSTAKKFPSRASSDSLIGKYAGLISSSANRIEDLNENAAAGNAHEKATAPAVRQAHSNPKAMKKIQTGTFEISISSKFTRFDSKFSSGSFSAKTSRL